MVSYGDLLDTSRAIEDDEDYLDQIIERINEHYQRDFGDEDRVVLESIVKEMTKGNRRESLATYAKQNGSEVFTDSIIPKDFRDIAFNL